MPQIPVPQQPNTRIAPPQTPDRIRAEESGVGALTAGGTSLTDIAAKVMGQKNDLDFANARVEYDNRRKAMLLDLSTNPDIIQNPQNYEAEANRGDIEIQQDIKQKLSGTEAGGAFANYVTNKFPANATEHRADGLKLIAKTNVAQLDVFSDEWSKLAAQETPEERDALTADFKDLTNRAFDRGEIDAIGKEHRIARFMKSTREGEAMFLAGGDSQSRGELQRRITAGDFEEADPIKLANAVAHGNTLERQEDERTKKVIHQAQTIVYDHLYSQALYGEADQGVLAEIQQNKNGLLKPEQGHALAKINDEAPAAQGGIDDQIRGIIFYYRGLPGQMTRDRLENMKKEINETTVDHVNTGGKFTKYASQAIDSVNNELNSMRGYESAELNQAIAAGKDKLKASRRPALPGRIGQMQRNRETIEDAELDTIIRQGRGKNPEDVSKAVDDLIKRRTERRGEKSEKQKNLEKALGN